MNIAVIGAGDHSRRNHLPSLALYARRNPGAVQLVALCDRDRARAEESCSEFGFERPYASVTAMLEDEKLDGCVAITPVKVNAEVTSFSGSSLMAVI